MKKKGLSQIISTVLLIAISVGLIGGIWVTVDTFVNERLDDTKNCYNLLGKIEFNNDYICYNSTAKTLLFSISIGEANISEALVVVEYEKYSNEFSLNDELSRIENLTFYKSTELNVSLPPANGGRSYILNTTVIPERIEISPKIQGKYCEVADSVEYFPYC